MAINDNQKVDFLWKKLTFGVTETDITGKEGFNETIASPVPTYSSDVWAQAGDIPVPAGELAGVVEFITVRCTADPTVAGGFTWLASSVFGDIDSRLTDWVAPTFDPAYLAFVYDGDPDAGGSPYNQGAADDEWVFDYVSGTLHFPNDPPNGTSEIWIRGYRYIGEKGLTGGAVGRSSLVEYADNSTRDLDGDVIRGQFAYVNDAGDGEYAFYVANSDGPTSNWVLVSTQDSANLDAKSLSTFLAHDSPSEVRIGNASFRKRVIKTLINVSSIFDGTPTLSVGIDSETSALASDFEVDLSTIGTYEITTDYEFTSTIDTDIKVFFAGGGATTGFVNVTVYFM